MAGLRYRQLTSALPDLVQAFKKLAVCLIPRACSLLSLKLSPHHAFSVACPCQPLPHAAALCFGCSFHMLVASIHAIPSLFLAVPMVLC